MPRHERAEFVCGTEQAYQAHYRRGEPQDDACRDAHAAYHRELRARPDRAPLRAERRRLAEARAAAVEALIHRHRAEFEHLLAAAERETLAELGE